MQGRLPNLNQLRAFESAARHLSFSQAAAELNVTATAISHRIRELEADLGEQLFVRHVRAVSLTPRALEFARELEAAFDRISNAVDEFANREMKGEVKISVAPFFGNRVFLPLLSRFHADYPDLKIIPTMSTEIVDLSAERLDAALRYGLGNWDGLDAIHIYTDSISPYAAPRLLANETPPLSIESIAAMTLASGSDGEIDWHRWFEALGMATFDALNTIAYSTRAASTDMALSGLGAALCERILVREDVAAGRLLPLHEKSVPSRKSMYLVFPKTTRPDPRLVVIANWLGRAIEDIR